jgi:hypothetical protein
MKKRNVIEREEEGKNEEHARLKGKLRATEEEIRKVGKRRWYILFL